MKHASTRRVAWLAGAAALGSLAGGPARAVSFEEIDGVQINLDTTLSAGFDLRTSSIDPQFVGRSNGGTLFTGANGLAQDNGTLNFRDGSVVSAPFRATEELQLKYGDYGVFVRATEFYDPIYDSVSPDKFKFTRGTVRDLGADARLLDAFTFGDLDVGDHRFTYRLGNQVINWGESIYIQGGINSFSAFDANALESPGAELREAVLPLPGIDVRTDLADNLSGEAFYEFSWVRTRFEPSGSFFSTTDTVSDGGYYSIANQYCPDSPSACYNRVDLAHNAILGGVILRSEDRHPKNNGEFGLALRYSAPFIEDSEFGLYFENYHSRTPFPALQIGSLASVKSNERALLGAPGQQLYFNSTTYRDEYPQDIRLLGASFSTTVAGGIGLQGEWSHRFNQPVLLANADAGLVLEGPALCQFAHDIPISLLQAACLQARTDPVTLALGGLPGFGQFESTVKRYHVDQFQVSATKVLDPIPGAGVSSWTLVGEIGADYVENFPRGAGLLDTPVATNVNSSFETLAGSPLHGLQTKGLATQAAGGYVITATFDMPDTLPYAIDMQPSIAWQHDFAGRDATGVGFFEEGRASVSLGVTFTYLQKIKFAVQYTNHVSIGPTTFDPLVDRDFISGAFSYTF